MKAVRRRSVCRTCPRLCAASISNLIHAGGLKRCWNRNGRSSRLSGRYCRRLPKSVDQLCRVFTGFSGLYRQMPLKTWTLQHVSIGCCPHSAHRIYPGFFSRNLMLHATNSESKCQDIHYHAIMQSRPLTAFQNICIADIIFVHASEDGN